MPSFTPEMACSTGATEQLLPLSEAKQQETYSKAISFNLWNCSGLLPAGRWLAGTHDGLPASLKHNFV